MTPGTLHQDAVAAAGRRGLRTHGAGGQVSQAAAAAEVKEHAMVAPYPPARAGDNAPVAPERVAAIRDAIRDGTYPLLPVKVADAMIAARLFLVYPGDQ